MIADKEAEMTVISFRRLYDLLTNMSRCQAFLGNRGVQKNFARTSLENARGGRTKLIRGVFILKRLQVIN